MSHSLGNGGHMFRKIDRQRTLENLAEPEVDAIRAKLIERRENASLSYLEARESREVTRAFPVEITVPTGDRCNIHCTFCTDRSSRSTSKYSDLSYSKFLEVITYLRPCLDVTSSIALYSWGEPLMNPAYGQMYDEIINTQYGAKIYISTNGILLDDQWAHKLVAYECSVVNVSLNAAVPETHRSLTRSPGFHAIINNLKYLIGLKKQVGCVGPFVSLSFVMVAENILELPNFIDLAAEIGVNVVVVSNLMQLEPKHIYQRIDSKNAEVIKAFQNAQWIAEERGVPLVEFSPTPFSMRQEPGICFEPWYAFKISSNGDVFPCCYCNDVMGNIWKHSFLDIWNGQGYQYYRATVNSPCPPSSCSVCFRKKKYQEEKE